MFLGQYPGEGGRSRGPAAMRSLVAVGRGGRERPTQAAALRSDYALLSTRCQRHHLEGATGSQKCRAQKAAGGPFC